MTEEYWVEEELSALHTCLTDDEFTEEEANAIVERVRNGENIDDIVVEYRPSYR